MDGSHSLTGWMLIDKQPKWPFNDAVYWALCSMVSCIVWLIDRLHVWAPSWAFTCHVCRTSWGWSCSSGWPGWWALEASWEPSSLSSCVAPRSVLNAHTLQGAWGVRYASGGTHKLIHYTNRHTILQIWMYFTLTERSVQDWKAEFFITIV